MKMSSSDSKGASGDRMSSEDIDMELEDEDPETYINSSEDDHDIEDEDEDVDCEDEAGVKLMEAQRREREALHQLHQSSLLKNNKTEKKLSFSVASLLGQKDEKDSDDCTADKTSLR